MFHLGQSSLPDQLRTWLKKNIGTELGYAERNLIRLLERSGWTVTKHGLGDFEATIKFEPGDKDSGPDRFSLFYRDLLRGWGTERIRQATLVHHPGSTWDVTTEEEIRSKGFPAAVALGLLRHGLVKVDWPTSGVTPSR